MMSCRLRNLDCILFLLAVEEKLAGMSCGKVVGALPSAGWLVVIARVERYSAYPS